MSERKRITLCIDVPEGEALNVLAEYMEQWLTQYENGIAANWEGCNWDAAVDKIKED